MSAAAPQPRDEVGELRAALERGEWRALLAPAAEGLLLQALLADASWWEKGADNCAAALCKTLPEAPAWLKARLLQKLVSRVQRHRRIELLDRDLLAAKLREARARLPSTGREYDEQARALALIEQYAPP